jgi:nucleoid DNA-binding protein
MTKRDLIRNVQDVLRDFGPQDVAFAVNVVFAAMTAAPGKDERIGLRGFDNFTVRRRRARKTRSPRNGVPASIGERRTAFFKVGKELRERINAPQ